MIEGLKPYSQYKESGLPWVGKTPAHWDLVPNRGLVKKRKVLVGKRHREYQLLSLTKQGVIVRDISTGKGKFSADMGTSQEVRIGDFVFCLFDVPETPRAVGLSHHQGMITGAYTVLEFLGRGDAYYFEKFYLAMDDRKLLSPLYSGLRHTIPIERLLGAKTPQPPRDEQAAIVKFLDYANGKIERAIRAKRKLIGLLNEQKQAIIHRAVTRGLDPNVKLKPSGIPWLGDVPEHWGLIRSKRLFAARKELAHPDDIQLSATQAYGVIPQADFEERVGRRVVKISMHLEKRRHVEKDDFVISMRSFQGGLERAWASGAIRSSYVVLKTPNTVDVSFFQYIFKSRGYIKALQGTADFIRDGQDLNYGNFCQVDLPVVPIAEQRAIANHIQRELSGNESIFSQTEREIDLLREYRTTLTAEVVTGKLDVREAAKRLPDQTDEPLPPDESLENLVDDEITEEDEA
jgi:type I restriction enzyme S subunit